MNRWKLATGVLAATTLGSAGMAYRFYLQRNFALNCSRYLVRKLEENDVELEEFDVIALQNTSTDSPYKTMTTKND